mmetsp:Transcript_20335/g.25094  ORF Transcript_20335/g.25094 Transcript_20335/m.25094 type:complete len:227 (-) Transcript_20335:117-797(-)
MNRFFGHKSKKKGKGKAAPEPTLNDVGSNLDKRVTNLEDKIKRLERQIIECKKKMQKSKGSAKNIQKQKALKLLKQKKQYEMQLERLMGQQMNIDNAKFAQESIKDNADMVKAMKSTATALKDAYNEINIDDVEDLQDEMMDLMDDANEINEILGQSYGMDDFDEDELQDELDGLDDELDDLDENEDEIPAYMQNAKQDVNANDTNNNDADVDEYGLPKVPQQLVN